MFLSPPLAQSSRAAPSPPPAPINISNNRNTMERIMKYFEFDMCCFCIDLRTGCLIIGYLNLIANLAMIPVTILGLIAASVISSGAINGKDMPKENIQNFGALMVGVLGVMLVLLILHLAFNIILLVGLHQYKRDYVKAYLIFTLIFIVLSSIAFLVHFGGPFYAIAIVRQIIGILVSIYFLLVIRSYYLKMEIPANMPSIYYKA